MHYKIILKGSYDIKLYSNLLQWRSPPPSGKVHHISYNKNKRLSYFRCTVRCTLHHVSVLNMVGTDAQCCRRITVMLHSYSSTVRLCWKVTVLIPDCVIGIFHWYNLSCRTMALGFTQPVTEMSTRNISWG